MTSLRIADLHQDLLGHMDSLLIHGNRYQEEQTGFDAIENSPIRLVIASTFDMRSPRGEREISLESSLYSEDLLRRYNKLVLSGKWSLVQTAADLEYDDDSIRILSHIEGLQVHSDNLLEDLERWFSAGCRSVGPMWNLDNGIGGTQDQEATGLTALGREAVRWIDSMPMLLDLSHSSVQTFWDTLEATEGPVLATYANARNLCDHPRNLSDDQLKAISERGGVVGLVLSKAFISQELEKQNLQGLLEHAEYIANLIGTKHLSIGTDLGGIVDPIEEISSVSKLPALSKGLVDLFGEDAEDILWGNSIRVIRNSLTV